MNFIINKEEFCKVVAAWYFIPNRTASDHIIYNCLRGHDLKRGFSPIKENSPKLANGAQPWQAFDQAKQAARWTLRNSEGLRNDTPERTALREIDYKDRRDALSKKYGVTFTPELMETMREMLK